MSSAGICKPCLIIHQTIKMGLQQFVLAKYLIFGVIILCQCIASFGETPGPAPSSNVSERQEVLDSNGKYKLIWNKDFQSNTITFKVIAETLGYVGFGISPNGGMTGADIVIGGVHPNGTSYFSDYIGVGNQSPKLDSQQDWVLLEATENGTHTILKFSRQFDTCDNDDFKIGNDTSNIIWAIGETDSISYHSTNRGSYSVNLLDPPMPDIDFSTVKTWRISSNFTMPAVDTTYWCTMHKSPALGSTHHVVGFLPYLPTAEAKAHTHHFIVHECRETSDPNSTKSFDTLMNSEGDHCYQTGKAANVLRYCKSFLLVWATGGKQTTFPENVGYAISSDNAEAYYMLQVHYNNPGKLKGVQFEKGVDILYTSKLREHEAMTLALGHDVSFSQIIPPKTKSFLSVGHCSSECTKESLPSSGLNVFNVLLHSHLAGRKIKVRHFRNEKELAWLSNDDNYNFEFQQNRPLRSAIKIFPGDQLAVECEYDTSDRENVTLGGFASSDEMCEAFLLVYPRTDLWYCGSSYPTQATKKDFGIEKFDFVEGSIDPVISAPKSIAGKRFTTILNEIEWTKAKVDALQTRTRFEHHTSNCNFLVEVVGANSSATITYPNITNKYVPYDSCAKAPLP